MRKYRNIELDYGVNTALIEAYKEMQAQMELADEEEEIEEVSEELTGIAPEMSTSDDMAAVEDYAVSNEFVNDADDSLDM